MNYQWNSEKTTYMDRGQRAYTKGDPLPDSVILSMGEETVDEYLENGNIIKAKSAQALKKEALEAERLELLNKALDLGLKPNKKTGIEKLNTMIADFNDLQDLKKEALALGIDPSDDVTFEELTILVDEKTTEKGKE